MTGLRLSALLASCFVLCAGGAPAFAGSFRAELNSGVEVVGEITDFRDGYYEFRVGRETKRIKLDELAKLTQLKADAEAQDASGNRSSLTPEFTLQQKSGEKTTGRIVQFKDGFYDVATTTGTVQVRIEDVEQVTLAWQEVVSPDIAAPFAEKLSGTFRIRASADAVENLVPDLLQFYAQASGQTGRWLPRNEDDSRTYSVGQSIETEKLRFEVMGDTPKSAIAAVRAGDVDLAIVAGEMPAEAAPVAAAAPATKAAAGEAAAAPRVVAKPPATEALKLGPAGAVVIVNAANPIDQLTYEQVAGIFGGEITDWSEIGGPHRRIRVHALAQPSGVYEIAKQSVLKSSDLMLSAYQVDGLAELSEIVSADPTTIGLTEAASVGAAKPVKIVDRCGTPRAPDELSIKLRSYPLTGAFVAHVAPKPGENAKKFREFLRSDQTQSYLSSRGLPNKLITSALSSVPNIEAAEAAGASEAPASGGAANSEVERLSIAFSFRIGSTQPADGSIEKIESLKAFLRNREGEPRQLAVVGFSDSLGKREANVAISRTRARNVQALLAKHGIETEKVLSLGPDLPLACETDPDGPELNRRVELWLY